MKVLVYLITLSLFLNSYAQDPKKNFPFKEIKVGDRMPDIPLGDVMNNYTGKTKFSQYKGKLVILDFWHSWCAPCIKAFPEMSELQRKFGDKIQVILVNYMENEEQLKNRSKKLGKALNIPDNLISIVNAKPLKVLFPPKAGIGYHVWIDPNGIICLRGPGMLDTYEEKIYDFLAGKKIDFIKDGDPFDSMKPLYSVAGNTNTSSIQYNSFFSNFSDDLGEAWGNNIINVWDSVSGTIRNTFANTQALDLYEHAASIAVGDSNILSGRRIVLLTNDTSRYTDDQNWYSGPRTDKGQRKCRFCYEQVTPASLPNATRLQYMLNDLNRYFGIMYGTEGKIEKRKISCWTLIRTSNQDKVSSSIAGAEGIEFIDQKGVTMNHYSNYTLKQLFESLIQSNNKLFSATDIIVNETGLTNKVDITLPDPAKYIQNIENLKSALNKYDLDIVRSEKEISLLVIKENNFHSMTTQ